MGNVLISALSENIGGVEEYVLNLSRYQADRNHSYSYILIGDHSPYEKEIKERKISYFKVAKKTHLLKSITTWYKVLKEQRLTHDTLYINTSSLGYILPYLIAYKLGYRLILHSHLDASKTSSLLKKIVHRLNYRVLRKKISDRFACSTPAAKWMFGKDFDKTHIIPNAIDLERFRFDGNRRIELKHNLGYKSDDFVIGNVGRLTEYKNQKFLLEMIQKIEDKSVKLLLVGEGEDREQLMHYCKVHYLDDRVTFYGKTDKPEDIMNVMDCIAMPSIAEGFPVSLVEDQAAGLTCFVSDIITPEVNINNNIHFLPLNEYEQWVDSIIGYRRQYDPDRTNKSSDGIVSLRNAGFDVNTIESRVWMQINKSINKSENK